MTVFGTLDRTVFRQILVPATLGFVTYTFLLMMRGIFTLMEQVFVRGVPARDALQVLVITVPHVVVLTIPMSFLFGVLLAVGRMNSDNEIIALQAAGISLRRLLRPVLALSLLLVTVNLYLYLVVMPWSNQELNDLKVRFFSAGRKAIHIEPGVFYEDFPNMLLYVRQVDPATEVWRDVILFDTTDPGQSRLILAHHGRIVSGPSESDADGGDLRAAERGAGSDPWLLLEDVTTHLFFPGQPETSRVNVTQRQLIRLRVSSGGTVHRSVGMAERDSLELLAFLRGGDLPDAELSDPEERAEQRRLAGIELHKRLAIPVACLVFGFLALPLGIGSRGGGRGRGFILSLGVVLVYYVVINNGELQALRGRIPAWLGMWLPNLLLLALALLLMRRMGRWLGERQPRPNPLARLLERLREARQERARSGRAAAPITGSLPVNIQRRRYRGAFPTLLDRYLLRRLATPLGVVLLSVVSLYVVVDLTDKLDVIAKNHSGLDVVVAYAANLVPQAVLDVTPFGLMISVLILFTILERQHELTALKGAGVSLYRLVVPIVLLAAVGAGAMWLLGESIVPAANRDAKRLKDRLEGRETARSYGFSERQWLLSRDDQNLYSFLRFDAETATLLRFTMLRIDEELRLRFHLFTERVRYENGAWMADAGGWFRRIDEAGNDDFHRITSPTEVGISEGPEYFGQEYRRPSEMNHRELRRYIDALIETGYRPGRLLVQWHQKFAYPASAFVMVFLALPFGLNRGGRRVSTMQGIAVALLLGISYFLLVALFGKMGEAGLLPPLLGAWAPAILAGLFAVNRLTTLRT